MQAFAALLDALVYAPQRTTKLALIVNWLRATPDPDRGWGLAALTGQLDFPHAKPALIRALVGARVDPVLFALSYDFVGDLAETAALIWPPALPLVGEAGGTPEISNPQPPSLACVATTLAGAGRSEIAGILAGWLDALDASGRFALLKLITGGLRVGVSARLAKTALARFGGVEVAAIEEVWHGLTPPYAALFAWLEGTADAPAVAAMGRFRPMMLAHALDVPELEALVAGEYACEWKWDGIRVQVAAGGAAGQGENGGGVLYSRTGDDITAGFPDLAVHLDFAAVLDGELLVMRDGEAAPFNDLQQRLGRKAVTAALQRKFPAHVRLYDILFEGSEDLRPLSFALRRRRLEAWYERVGPQRMDLSALIPFSGWDELARLREGAREAGQEGLMLKRLDSAYVGGRPRGLWWKWKRDPHTADCVLMYAQRGHGKRSSFYSDFTFGCWRRGEGNVGDLRGSEQGGAPDLVPVGKAYFGFTDAELLQLDRWVRTHTIDRFGPVRAVAPELVLEIAFDAVQPSPRHRSGLAMRFPRVRRIRWDKPAREADTLDALRALVDTAAPAQTL